MGRTTSSNSWPPSTGPRRAGGGRRRRRAAKIAERLEAEESGLSARRRHSGEAHLTGSTRIEDDERGEESRVFGFGMAAGVVELVENVGVDPAGTPFPVV